MIQAFIILGIVTLLSYLSQRHQQENGMENMRWDIYLIILTIFLILMFGLRKSYNDTINYRRGYKLSVDISTFLSERSNFDIFSNPLFYAFQSLIRTMTSNYTYFFLICACYINILNVSFIKKNTEIRNFAFSMFIYAAIGTMFLTMAAIKQALAMATLTLALNALMDRKYIKYYLIVFIAGLIHTYAWIFAILPLFYTKPWSFRTLLLLLITLAITYTFKSSIESILKVADQAGKTVAKEEVFDNNKMNIFRVGIYTIMPAITLLFKSYVNKDIDKKNSLFIQMSIISFMFILLATQNGANMFGRAANYFIYGYICAFPWVIRQIFTSQSVKIVSFAAIIGFTAFFLYDNRDFDKNYQHKTLKELIVESSKDQPIDNYNNNSDT
ncbi:EpsG family protein [Sharpea azabuensis]|uniref:EpsG family protein n=1 Tax=Sharpea azabuensis TaxID=322505 RepID=UPI0024093C3C|nr:EpsG family protein [Sharpea azabuensis]MDD6512905.1 EpsG family protein [Sharpea azabuensis]